MNYFITGVAGFIGSNLANFLLEKGNRVIGIDNFDTFYSKSVKVKNIEDLKINELFHFKELDILDTDGICSFVNSIEKPDVFIHIAAKAGVRPSIENPEDYLSTNIDGTRSVLETMKRLECEKLVFASSSSVYGNAEKVPFKEEDVENKPISPYAFTKRSCELLNYTYHHLYNIDVLNLRLFTVYGPRQRPDLAIHKFIKLALDNKPIEIYGDGSTSRDYTFVTDIVNGFYKASNYLMNNKNVFENINIGSGSPINLLGLVDLLDSNLDDPIIKKFGKMQAGDVDQTFADIGKAKRLLDFSPQISIEEGIKGFVDWYKGDH